MDVIRDSFGEIGLAVNNKNDRFFFFAKYFEQYDFCFSQSTVDVLVVINKFFYQALNNDKAQDVCLQFVL